jgi:ribosome maturation factor RimP
MRLAEGNRADLKQMAARMIDLLEPELATAGFDLLDVRIFRGGGRVQLRIYVDLTDGGISLSQVASASRTVSMLLEEADPFPDPYVIEVSSPGIRRPLRKIEHYQAAVGSKVDLRVMGPGRRRVRGILQEVDGDQIVVAANPADQPESEVPEGETEEIKVPFRRILEGNLDTEFDVQAMINADRRKRKEDKRQKRESKKKGPKKSRPRSPKKSEDDSSADETE